jgi:hypothetical protein
MEFHTISVFGNPRWRDAGRKRILCNSFIHVKFNW